MLVAENLPRKMADEKPNFAIVSDEPTPYRLHVLNRVANEISEAKLTSVFTHPKPSMPWDVSLAPDINAFMLPGTGLYETSPISFRSLSSFRLIRDHLIAQNTRLIILLGYNSLTRLKLIHWAQKSSIPLLLTGDSNVFSEGRLTGAKRAVKRRFIRHVLKSVVGLMPMGTAGRAYFRLYADHELPTFLFPYEPDYDALRRNDEPARRALCEKHGLQNGRHRLLFCGRLIGVKRIDVLIDAFARVAASRPDWDLVIAGDGPLKNELTSRVPAALRGRVKWLGFLQFQDTVACYHSCDGLVLPSEYEPWALVINEAVAAGLAVVATEVVGAAIELVRHGTNGLLIAPRSVESMTNALLEVTKPERCRAMRAAAPAVLAQWRAAADPVDGVRQALKHFGLLS